MRALKNSLIIFVYIDRSEYSCYKALAVINTKIWILILLLYVRFLCHSPWLNAGSEYLRANRSCGSPMTQIFLIKFIHHYYVCIS